MKKQTAALREVNDSRLRIYEQLEVSVQDLERANHRLAIENANDKKQIKSQCITIDNLEARIEELQKKYEELKQYEVLLREQKTQYDQLVVADVLRTEITISQLDASSSQNTATLCKGSKPTQTDTKIHPNSNKNRITKDEDEIKLCQQLQELRVQRTRDIKRIAELEDQLDTLLIEHTHIEEQINSWKAKAQNMKNLQDEINTLEEVRQGHLCGRCLRGTDSRTHNELLVMLDPEEDDEISIAESLANNIRDIDTVIQDEKINMEPTKKGRCNPYRDLVDKYEALMRVQETHILQEQESLKARSSESYMSLQEELQMSGEFDGQCGSGLRPGKKLFGGTLTDFSETETSSSGFADETSNKSTQTEGRPGLFLCSIADGEDWKLSIYDDNSTFESRFQKTPEYRKIFSEIFKVLKQAAEAKDEGTTLPLLEKSDSTFGLSQELNNTRVTTRAMEAKEIAEDALSVDSLAISSVVSEPAIRISQDRRNISRHQPLEYLSVQVRKKGPNRRPLRRTDTPHEFHTEPKSGIAPVQGRISGRRRFRPLTTSELTDGLVWNGNTAHFYPTKSLRGKHQHGSNLSRDRFPSAEYKPGTASEEVAKLRRLEMSYAEALRTPNKSKASNPRHDRNY